jgi:hypothetical protein
MHPAIGKTGGCQCTAVRYELIGIPKMLYACQLPKAIRERFRHVVDHVT